MPHCKSNYDNTKNIMTAEVEKQRIPNEMSLSLEEEKTILTKCYGELTKHQLYHGYFLPMLVKSKLRSNIENYSKVPFKISIEIDKEKLEKLTEKEQQFFVDAVDRKALSTSYTKEEIRIFQMATQDVIYLL